MAQLPSKANKTVTIPAFNQGMAGLEGTLKNVTHSLKEGKKNIFEPCFLSPGLSTKPGTYRMLNKCLLTS